MKNKKFKKLLVMLLFIGICLVMASCKPDLIGSIQCPAKAIPGEDLKDNIKVELENTGSKSAKNFSVDLALSQDQTIPHGHAGFSANFSEDVLLKGGREFVSKLDSNESMNLTLNGANKIPEDTPPGNYYIGFVVDSGKSVSESNENNNTGVCPIEILDCDPIAQITDCQIIGAAGGTVGFATLRLKWIYGNGEKPHKLLITIYRFAAQEWQNVMPSNQPFDVPTPQTTTDSQITIFRLFSGKYKIVMNASYSCDREEEFIFERQI